jgi:hypothetical protein
MSRTTQPTLRLATHPKALEPDVSRTRVHVARRYLQKLQVIARELYEHELFREATDLFRYLTMVDPTNPTHWYWLGRSLIAVGDPLGAARVFELGGRLSHIGHFSRLAADAWNRAGCPDKAEAALNLTGFTP